MKKFLSYTTIKNIFTWALAHKVISAVVVVAIVGGGYWTYTTVTSSDGETRYILGTVEKNTVIASVSASGQVSASNQLEIQAKASGEIISINVSPSQKVAAGALIAVLDPTAAQKAVRDAEVNLESAKLSLEKLKRPADNLSLIQAENALAQATSDVDKAYDDGFNSVANAFLDLPGVMTGLEDILYGDDVAGRGQDNIYAYSDMIDSYNEDVYKFKDDAVAKYQKARQTFDATFLKYRSLSRSSDRTDVESLIAETYDTTKIIADSVKSTHDFLGFVEDELTKRNFTVIPILTTHLTLLDGYTGDTNGHLLTLLGIKDTITTSKYSISEKTESLAELKAGSDEIDIKSSELTLKQRENALTDAKNALADYYVRAPFAGTIATIGAKKYDNAGSGTAIATLITSQKIAELSLNEVDAAKISIGDKATLTFDAIESLTLTGEVAEIDAIGTVTQGVVSYTVKIGFDSQDERIKSGMTANASIQIDVRQDVLAIPSSAVKTQNGVSYVQVFNPALPSTNGTQGVVSNIPPQQVEVTVGISDDTSVEILSGLEEGQQIVTRTVTGSATTNTTPTNNARSGGLGAPAIRF